MRNSFRYFNSSPEVIRLAVMMYIRYPLSPRQVEDLLFERGIARMFGFAVRALRHGRRDRNSMNLEQVCKKSFGAPGNNGRPRSLGTDQPLKFKLRLARRPTRPLHI